jgi:hypothetical protein
MSLKSASFTSRTGKSGGATIPPWRASSRYQGFRSFVAFA